MAERDSRTAGAEKAAEAAQAAAAEKVKQYQEALKQARGQVYAEQEAARKKLLDERAARIKDARTRAAAPKPRRVPALPREKLDDAKSFLFLCCEYSICVALRRSWRERCGRRRQRVHRTRHGNLQVDQLCHCRRRDRLGLWQKASAGVSKESGSHRLGDRKCH